jgi:hypothetical protein
MEGLNSDVFINAFKSEDVDRFGMQKTYQRVKHLTMSSTKYPVNGLIALSCEN